MLLIIEIVGLILISSTLSSAESFAYLLFGYIFVKIARSWLKGKTMPSITCDVLQNKSLVCGCRIKCMVSMMRELLIDTL